MAKKTALGWMAKIWNSSLKQYTDVGFFTTKAKAEEVERKSKKKK